MELRNEILEAPTESKQIESRALEAAFTVSIHSKQPSHGHNKEVSNIASIVSALYHIFQCLQVQLILNPAFRSPGSGVATAAEHLIVSL